MLKSPLTSVLKESVQMGFSIIFWWQDPYNWYVVLGPHSKILLENCQNWELLSCKVAKIEVVKIESCQNGKLLKIGNC